MVVNMSIPGQMTQIELTCLASLASRVPENGVVVETGSLFGRSSATLATSVRNSVQVFCIDPWVRDQWIIDLVESKTADCLEFSQNAFLYYTRDSPNIIPLRGYSPKDFRRWERPVHLYFEDSVHTNPVLSSNLKFWFSHMVPGGIMCGHDYCDLWPDVKQEVDALALQIGATVNVIGDLWWFEIPCQNSTGLNPLEDTAVVFSCDETFFPLAKGLVLSLRTAELKDTLPNLFCIDIGLSPKSVLWLQEQRVEVLHQDWKKNIKGAEQYSEQGYRLAQYIRPHLPDIIPGFDYYLWLDADIWIQEPAALRVVKSTAEDYHGAMAIVPTLDASYRLCAEDIGFFMHQVAEWSKPLYGEIIARNLSLKSHLNSGMFCLAAKSPIWRQWENELKNVKVARLPSDTVKHLAEQTCLNYILFSTGLFVPLDASFNYNLFYGNAWRHPLTRKVVMGGPVSREISVVHLNCASMRMKQYVADGLLYKCGEYLTFEEREGLLRLSK